MNLDLGIFCEQSLPKTGSSDSSMFRDLGIMMALLGALVILGKRKSLYNN